MHAPPFKPPQPGDRVGDYRVDEKLGDGGFGFVYRVERAGRFYAMKVIRARELEGWGQREITILRHVVHDNVVRFRACDRWPDPDHGYLCFIMDLVVGRTLEQWALEENPTARQVVRVLLEVALALAEILEQGVLHRDLKRENILIRDSDGRPVLVDFGIGYLAGEPTLTGERSLPGTDEYRTPEFVRHEQDNTPGKAGYRPGVGDELWALGVTLYWLLTDVLPFGHRAEGGLYDRILHQRPVAPHALNPRVPLALSAVCMRMLEKRRGARFSGYGELCGALDAALASADERWDVPLMDPDAPDATPTVKVPGMGPPAGEEQAGLVWKADRPRRGRKAAREPRPVPERGGPPAVPEPPSAKLAEPPAPAKVARGAVSPAEALVAVLAEVAPRHAWEGLPPPVPESAPPAPGVPSAAAVAILRPAALLVVAVGALALAGVGAWVVHTRPAPGSPSTVRPVALASPRVESPREGPPARACAVREVAGFQEWPEAGGGAAFSLPPTPASVLATMLRKEDSRSRPEETPAALPQRKGIRARFMEKCVGAACCAVLGACTGAPVRPSPQPEACSSKALATMKELEIDIGDEAAGTFPVVGSAKPVPVQESTTFALQDDLGKLKAGTVLSGRLIFGQDRVYGRFTQARQARSKGGQTYPVCLELQYRGQRGTGYMRDSGPASPVVGSVAEVQAVDRFE
ncbi:MAG TPA: protein kinase [Archangium sp.]|uniref:serine/threonine protein kinase n=1 Tax=Archangium sp. TaxID=1872627 RepID=UPI002E306355|nr:protein kinase [Archangium sp.]HEX5754360.1 protein kinase [Archangium sp.]